MSLTDIFPFGRGIKRSIERTGKSVLLVINQILVIPKLKATENRKNRKMYFEYDASYIKINIVVKRIS